MSKKIKLLYIGKRFNTSDGSLSDHFLQEDLKTECVFAKLKWVVIGRWYEASETAKGITIARTPEEVTSKDVDEDKLTEYQTRTHVAEEKARKARASKRIEKTYAYQEACDALERVSLKLSDSELRYLAETMVNAISEKRWAKVNADVNARLKKAFNRNVKIVVGGKPDEKKT